MLKSKDQRRDISRFPTSSFPQESHTLFPKHHKAPPCGSRAPTLSLALSLRHPKSEDTTSFVLEPIRRFRDPGGKTQTGLFDNVELLSLQSRGVAQPTKGSTPCSAVVAGILFKSVRHYSRRASPAPMLSNRKDGVCLSTCIGLYVSRPDQAGLHKPAFST